MINISIEIVAQMVDVPVADTPSNFVASISRGGIVIASQKVPLTAPYMAAFLNQEDVSYDGRIDAIRADGTVIAGGIAFTVNAIPVTVKAPVPASVNVTVTQA